MELRYVYRRVEDSIGSPLNIEESPHAALTRGLRIQLREAKDALAHTSLVASCMAALAGNPSVDVSKLSVRVSDHIEKAFYERFPYIEHEDEDTHNGQPDYSKYFAHLDEIEEHERQAKAAASNTGKNDDIKKTTE